MSGLFDQIILSQSLPEVFELIFVRHLPYADLESCLRVSRRWRSVLASHLLQPGTASRRACESARLAHAWTQEDLTFAPLEAWADGMSVCFVDGSPFDVVVVLTGHGQRRCALLRLDHSGAVLARSERVFAGALSSVAAAGDLLVFQLAAGARSVEAADRRTLAEVPMQIGGRRSTLKRLTAVGNSSKKR